MTTKICTKCREEKDLSEFSKKSSNKSGHRSYCRGCASIQGKEYRENNKEKITKRMKIYREDNKEEISKQNSKRYFRLKDNVEFITKRKIARANHYKNNKELALEINKRWMRNNPEKARIIINRRLHKRKRELGYNPLNKKFLGSVGHHINRDDVVFIPEELHKSILHRQDDQTSMEEINILAMEYL